MFSLQDVSSCGPEWDKQFQFDHAEQLLVSMILRRVTVKTVGLVDLVEMRKTECLGKTRLVLHIPSSS